MHISPSSEHPQLQQRHMVHVWCFKASPLSEMQRTKQLVAILLGKASLLQETLNNLLLFHQLLVQGQSRHPAFPPDSLSWRRFIRRMFRPNLKVLVDTLRMLNRHHGSQEAALFIQDEETTADVRRRAQDGGLYHSLLPRGTSNCIV